MAYVTLGDDILGLGNFGKNIGDSAIKLANDMRSFFEISIRTFSEWWDDFWYGLSNLLQKIINVSEIFIVCFFVWLGIYTILYPQDLYDKGMEITKLGLSTIGGTLNRGASLLI